jgi:hypothetical protein
MFSPRYCSICSKASIWTTPGHLVYLANFTTAWVMSGLVYEYNKTPTQDVKSIPYSSCKVLALSSSLEQYSTLGTNSAGNCKMESGFLLSTSFSENLFTMALQYLAWAKVMLNLTSWWVLADKYQLACPKNSTSNLSDSLSLNFLRVASLFPKNSLFSFT